MDWKPPYLFSLTSLVFFFSCPNSIAALPAPAKAQSGISGIGDKWAVVIGISQFSDSKVPRLKYAAKDATDFYNYLTDPQLGRFAKDHVQLLTNENATKVNIMDTLGDSFLPHAALPEDLVIIYLSTHGSPAGEDICGINYIITYDTQVDKLFATGIEMKQLFHMIKERVHTKRIVLILDTCYSGAGGEVSHKGLTRSNVNPQEIAQGIGSLVISSSSPNQRSWESDELKNSYFTRYLIDSLHRNNSQISLSNAFDTMKQHVQSAVLHDKGELQTPVMSGTISGPGLVLSTLPSAAHMPPLSQIESNITKTKNTCSTNNLQSYTEHMHLASRLINEHKFWDAAHELEAAAASNPQSVEVYLVSADVYNEQNRHSEEMEAAKRAVINDNSSSRSHVALSRAYLNNNQIGDALRQAQIAVTLDPNSSLAHNLLGYIQEHKYKHTDQAEQEYRKALSLNPVNTQALINLGSLLESQGQDIIEARELYQKAVESNADDWQAHYALGRLLNMLTQYNEAENELRKAIALEPSNYKLHCQLGVILSNNTSRLDEAEREMRKGVQLGQGEGQAHYCLARFLLDKLMRFDEAEIELRKAIGLDGNLDEARVALGNLLISYHHIYDEAERQFHLALATNPKNAYAILGLASVYADLYKNYSEAEKELLKALNLKPTLSIAHDRLGLLLSTAFQRYDEAEQEWLKALQYDPKNADVHYHLGNFYLNQQKDFGKAMSEFTSAIRLNPESSDSHTKIGYLLAFHDKKYKEAEVHLRQATNLNPANAEAHYYLGLLLVEKLGQRRQGESELRKANQICPENAEFKQSCQRYCR